MSLSDSRPGPFPPLWIPSGRWTVARPPCRVSQVPRPIFPRALSPSTPEGPASAPARCFPAGVRLHPLRKTGHLQLIITRPNRVHFRYGSQVRIPGFHQTDHSIPLRFRYTYERATYMVNSFQFTRSARLTLVCRSVSEGVCAAQSVMRAPHPFTDVSGSMGLREGDAPGVITNSAYRCSSAAASTRRHASRG